MSVIYHETPALSERGAFTNLIKNINKEIDIDHDDYDEQWTSFGQKLSQPSSQKKYDETKTWKEIFNEPDFWLFSRVPHLSPFEDTSPNARLVDQLEFIAEVLEFLTNPMIMHSGSFDEKSAQEWFESLLDENNFSLDVEQMNGFTPVLEILAQVRRILFTTSSHNTFVVDLFIISSWT